MLSLQLIAKLLNQQVIGEHPRLFEVYITNNQFVELHKMWKREDYNYETRLRELASLIVLDDVPEAYMKLARGYVSQDDAVRFYDLLYTYEILDKLSNYWGRATIPSDASIKEGILSTLVTYYRGHALIH